MHCTDVHKTKVMRPTPRRYIFKTETRPRNVKSSILKTEMRLRHSIFRNFRDRDETETFQKTFQDRLETETFKTETTSLQLSIFANILLISLPSEKHHKEA